jgi:hypothetical protein
MPTKTRFVAGIVAATLGVVAIVVAVVGTLSDWGAETTSEAQGAAPSSGTAPETRQAGETPEEFLAALATAVREGDVDFQVERLAPAVIDRYGEDACRADVATRTDPTRAFAVTQVRDEPATFDYNSDGLSEAIPDTIVMEAQMTLQGATSAQEVHLVDVGGEFSYFTDCGTPIG